jgi:ankyrin repeat protein
MAPEQFKGRAVAATDLYGLGVTLLYLLTHRSPTELPHENLRINFRSRVQVFPALAQWLEKLVAPDLESRFSTAEEALTALKQSQWVNKKNWLKVGMSIAGLATVGLLGFHYRWILLSRLGFYPEGCNTGAIETYLEQGGRMEKLVTSRDSAFWCGAERDYAGDSVAESLISVAASGKVDVVKRLLSAGAAVDVQDYNGKTPLYKAASRGNVEVVKRLLSAGADVNIQNDYGWTPLHKAASGGSVEIVKLLLSAGADVKIQNDYGDTPLHKAASRGNVEVVKRLLSAGAAVDVQNNYNGETPLHRAASRGNVEEVKRLLSAGAEVNVRDDGDETPLHVAASEGNEEVVKRLLSAGAAVDVQNNYNGETPLHRAAYIRDVEVVKRLLSAGANPNIQDQDGDTALDETETDDEEIRELLRRHSKQP